MRHASRSLHDEELLEHSGWMRGLALSLARGDAAADDALQETYLKAVENPPKGRQRVRSWLATVLKNTIYSQHRVEKHRLEREHAVARAEADSTTPPVTLERAEIQVRVAEEVLKLDEPYRSTILLRFFDDLSPSEIARRQQVPVSTVWTRLERAKEKLRLRLDKLHGGDRRMWVGAILSISSIRATGEAAASNAAAIGAAVLETGGSLMMRKAVIAAAVSAAALVVLTVGLHVANPSGRRSGDSTGSQPRPPSPVAAARESRPEGRDSTRDSAASARPESSEPRGEPATTSAPPADAVGLRHAAEEKIQAALAAVPAPERLEVPGPGAITGAVRTRAGVPVAGVTVRAVQQTRGGVLPDPGGVPDASRELVSKIYTLIEDYHRQSLAAVEAMTDGEGNYTIQGLHQGVRYTIEPVREGWSFRFASLHARKTSYPMGWEVSTGFGARRRDAVAGDVADFEGDPVVDLPVLVQFSDGSTPPVAEIYFKPSGKSDASVQNWYPEAPTLRLYPGAFDITARTAEDHAFKSDNVEVRLVAGMKPPTVTLKLEARTGIAGRVNFPAEEMPEDVLVYALRIGGAGEVDPQRLPREGRSFFTAKPRFKYYYRDILPGTYLIGVGRVPHDILATTTLEVEKGTIAESEITVPPMDPSEHVVLRAFDPQDRPHTHLSARFVCFQGGRRVGADRGTIRKQDGSFWVLYPEVGAGGNDGETLILELDSLAYGMKRVPIERGAREVSVSFDEPASLEVTIQGYASGPLVDKLRLGLESARAELRAGGEREAVPELLSVAPVGPPGIDSRGVQSFGPLPPGAYVVVVMAGDENQPGPVVGRHGVSLKAGANRVTVPLPRLHRVTVLVGAERERATVFLRSASAGEGGGVWRAASDAQGQATFTLVPKGRYELSALGSPSRADLIVDSDATIAFDFEVASPPTGVGASR
jgi:RNA polymerase sigma-70 factor (ECF subfamily)